MFEFGFDWVLIVLFELVFLCFSLVVFVFVAIYFFALFILLGVSGLVVFWCILCLYYNVDLSTGVCLFIYLVGCLEFDFDGYDCVIFVCICLYLLVVLIVLILLVCLVVDVFVCWFCLLFEVFGWCICLCCGFVCLNGYWLRLDLEVWCL